jgi:hypothetical protein
MKRSLHLIAPCLIAFANVAGAYEYPLQFTPNPGYRGLIVAGYAFQDNTVIGNCSYYTVSSGGSGKGGGVGTVPHRYQQTCKWDLFGNLLSVTPGAPAVPAPVSTNGGVVVYATNANGISTGTDSKLAGRGFVNTPGAHYTWITPSHTAVALNMVYTLVTTLKSDGDVPLDIAAVAPSAQLAAVTLKSTTCIGQIAVGKTCSVTLTYDPTGLSSATGLAYDTLRVDLTSNAGEAHDFIQKYTIILPEKP